MKAPQYLAIAQQLESLVAKAMLDFNFGLEVLKIPMSVRVPLWQALSRRAAAKAIECEKKGSAP